MAERRGLARLSGDAAPIARKAQVPPARGRLPHEAIKVELLGVEGCSGLARWEARVDRGRIVRFILLALVLIPAFYWVTTQKQYAVKAFVGGWGGMGFLVVAIVGLARQLRLRGVVVTIDADGFEDRRLSTGKIPWQAIRALSLRSFRGNEFLCVEFDAGEEERWLGRQAWWRRAMNVVNHRMGFPGLTINFSTTDGSAQGAFDAALKWCDSVQA